MSEFLENIRLIQQEKNISEELVLKNIENSLKAAYKRRFGIDENAIVKFHDGNSGVSLYAQKAIVPDEDLDDPVLEIALSEAQGHSTEAEIGDLLLFEIDPKNDFARNAVDNAKQRSRKGLRELQKDTLYSEYKDKLGELIIGYNQRDRNGNVYINLGKTEGIMPKRFQSSREIYSPGNRIKVLIEDVQRHSKGLQIVLSRSSPELVRKLFEVEVSEIYDGTVDIYKVVREAGLRTKMAVYSYREGIDPVGACVGLKGSRIQNVIRELEGEKIDVLSYDSDPVTFIKNALSPAQIKQVYITNHHRKAALAIVDEEQLSLAIGRQGINIRLASRLVGWSINIKTQEQFDESDLIPDTSKFHHELFNATFSINTLEDLDDINENLIEVLARYEMTSIKDLQNVSLTDIEKIFQKESMDLIEEIQGLIDNNADAIDGFQSTGDVEEVEEVIIYQCPECEHEIQVSMSECPNCHIGLSFEEE